MRWIQLLTVLVLAGAAPAAAQKPDNPGHERGKGKGEEATSSVKVAVFSDRERTTIRTYFSEHRTEVQSLPPGIAKNLARGKPLPPGIAKRQIPTGLRSRLVERSNESVLIIGDRIVLVDPVGLVVDVLDKVF
jgi:hypothetical protein